MKSITCGRALGAMSLVVVAIGVGYGVAAQEEKSRTTALASSIDGLQWVKSPLGGTRALIHRSSDGTHVFAAFREAAGHAIYTYPFDEYAYVTSGTGHAEVRGGPSLDFQKGDVFYFKKGTVIDFTLSENFSDVAVLSSEKDIKW